MLCANPFTFRPTSVRAGAGVALAALLALLVTGVPSSATAASTRGRTPASSATAGLCRTAVLGCRAWNGSGWPSGGRWPPDALWSWS